MELDASTRSPARPCRDPRIDSFLASLSPWELLRLREDLRSHNIKITGLADLSDLPSEIVSMIAVKLELDDVLCCRMVSRSWHATWTRGAVTSTICHYFFPGLLEKAEIDQDARSPAELLQSCIDSYLWHKRGAYPESSFIEWTTKPFANPSLSQDDELNKELSRPKPFFKPFYAGGMLAWQVDLVSAIVYDIRTHQHHLCSFAAYGIDSWCLELQGMSSNLLVFSAKRRAFLDHRVQVFIWHIQFQTWERFPLPDTWQPLKSCFVEGEQVAIVTDQGSIIRWSWGGRALELDQSASLNMIPEGYETGIFHPGVILDPKKQRTTYLAMVYQSKSKVRDGYARYGERVYLMSVVRYEDEVPTHRWLEIIQRNLLSTLKIAAPYMNSYIALLCPRMSAYGLYSIGTVWADSGVVEFATTAFSIYKESFIQRPIRYRDFFDIESMQSMRKILHATKWYPDLHSAPLTTWSEMHPMVPYYYHVKAPDSNDYKPEWKACRIYGDDDFRVSISNTGFKAWSFRDGQTAIGRRRVGV
ncbi:hypothetical protein E4U43_001688 [Claviceps pusilla]|uniref:F-box domain-containing protein n=1 Tax=Claviceps pusilla TaxID=123648 RepID=A0A9P7N7M9_9HYPO|nr:hypothetical protein E4U43_001688 [Claviceps pusilla]